MCTRFEFLGTLAGMAGSASGQSEAGQWKSLFNGKSLDGWDVTPFSGRAEVKVADGAIQLSAGYPLTGVTYAGEFPRIDYEIRFEASRVSGNDFFASLTFPVGASFATLVTGGWGGDIVGISSIDNWDASDNETRTYVDFTNGRWYGFRLRVNAGRLRAWIDEKPVVDVSIAGRTVGLRYGEIKLSAPLGFASYLTAGAVRKIEYRPAR
jgi:hypothetical protein